METLTEFRDWLNLLAEQIANNKASVALVTITESDIQIAGAGTECADCLAYLLSAARKAQPISRELH